MGGIWNPFSIVPSGISAFQVTAQTLVDTTEKIIIFDDVFYDLYPATVTVGTGTISVTAASGAIVGTATTFVADFSIGDTITANNETHTVSAIADNTHMTTDNWSATKSSLAYTYSIPEYNKITGVFTAKTKGQYLITSGVSFASSSDAGEVIIQIVVQEGMSSVALITKSIYVPTAATDVTVDVSGILQLLSGDQLWISVTQSTGANQTTLLDDNTWLGIQKLK